MKKRLQQLIALVPAYMRPPAPPLLRPVLFVLVPLLALPFAAVTLVRSRTSPQPRIAILQDMGTQPKFKAQAANAFFADGRAMRPPVAGTVARGRLDEDDHYYRGYEPGVLVKNPDTGKDEPKWFDGLPPRVDVTESWLRRGRERFGIYCAVCHGEAGFGDGMVHRRAEKLKTPGWVQPTSLHGDAVRKQADGQLFNTITHGKGNMGGYGAQIAVDDRWAIVAYLRALQASQRATAGDMPAAGR